MQAKRPTMNPTTLANQLPNAVNKTSAQLYRDCLRLVSHVGGKSSKGNALRVVVRSEFRKNAAVEDAATVDALRANAVRALSNYLLFESGSKDAKVKQRMSEQGVATGVRRAPIGGGLVPPTQGITTPALE